MGNDAFPLITEAFARAWNSHDMTAFGELFHADATFVNRFATYWRGVEAIVAGHEQIHRTVYRDSTLMVDTPDVDGIAEDAAILHFWCRLTAGPAHPAGSHEVDTLIMAVVTRRGGAWRIQAAENVALVDPSTGAPVPRIRQTREQMARG